MNDVKKFYNEALINGEKVHYHGCTTNKNNTFYTELGWKLIGESKITFHDGSKCEWDETHYFFINPTK